MSDTPSRPAVLIYCELLYGAGHWMRIRSIALALSRRFRVLLFLIGKTTADLAVPAEIECVGFAELRSPLDLLLNTLRDVRPYAVLLEYYPFGRQLSSLHLIPFIKAARESADRPVILTSLRDIQDSNRADQHRFDLRVVQTANRLIDAILVHSDPAFTRLEETFGRAAELTVPVLYTGYVVPDTPAPPPCARNRTILVSVGGGRSCAPLLLRIMDAYRGSSLSRDYAMRMIAGSFIEDDGWSALCEAAEEPPAVELLRWVPSLIAEMAQCAVSVSRCGYNTTLDILRTAVPAVIIPSVELGENEQSLRAARLEKQGVWSVLHESAVSPESFERTVRKAASGVPSHLSIDCGGAENTVTLIEESISRRARD